MPFLHSISFGRVRFEPASPWFQWSFKRRIENGTTLPLEVVPEVFNSSTGCWSSIKSSGTSLRAPKIFISLLQALDGTCEAGKRKAIKNNSLGNSSRTCWLNPACFVECPAAALVQGYDFQHLHIHQISSCCPGPPQNSKKPKFKVLQRESGHRNWVRALNLYSDLTRVLQKKCP